MFTRLARRLSYTSPVCYRALQLIATELGRRKNRLDMSGITKSALYLNVLEHKRMVADLPQLHDRIHQSFGAAFALQNKR